MMRAAGADEGAGGGLPRPAAVGPVSGVRGGATWDFDSLYVARYADMVRLAYFLTGSAAQAEEATQESFVRLYERWTDIEHPEAYLRTSVVNRCRSWHRSRFASLRRQHRIAASDRDIDHPDEISDILATLPRRRREVIVLRFYGGLPLTEIADVLGITEGTVKSTLHRALEELRGALHD